LNLHRNGKADIDVDQNGDVRGKVNAKKANADVISAVARELGRRK
jgi:hypothetical protein